MYGSARWLAFRFWLLYTALLLFIVHPASAVDAPLPTVWDEPADLRRYSSVLSSLASEMRDFGCSDRRAVRQPGNPSPVREREQ